MFLRPGPLLLLLFTIGVAGIVGSASVQVINGTQPQVVASYSISMEYSSVGVASPVAAHTAGLHVGYSSTTGASPGAGGPASAVGTGYSGLIVVHYNETGQNETIVFWPPQNETVTQPPSSTVTVTVTKTVVQGSTTTILKTVPQAPTELESGGPDWRAIALVGGLVLLLLGFLAMGGKR